MIKRFFKNLILRITSCVMAIVTLFSAGGCSLADVFAWMTDNGLSSPIDITSNVHKTYFNGGDGSKGDPYQIDNALQLYYFAWLQDLGLFNVDSNDEGTEIDTVYFVLTDNIDMDGYKLPSVGTTQYPFLGNFDGNGKTISNLTVENERDHLFEPPTGSEELEKYAEIIGFFGVVGSLPNDNSYSYESTTNEIKNLLIQDITIATHTEKALAGFVAGYANGIIDCVGVVGGTIKMVNTPIPTTYTDTGNISDYALIGYCTTNCKNQVYVIGTSISAPNSTATYQVVLNNSNDGEGQGWGGSVKMSDIYTWLSAIRNKNNITNANYILERTDVKYLSGKTVTKTRTTASRKAFTVDNFGSFVFDTTSLNASYVNFVAGGQKVTEYAYEYSTEDETVYYIMDGTNYLCFDGDNLYRTQDKTDATTTWYASNGTNGGSLYTVIDDNIYYLTIANGDVSVLPDVVAASNPPNWKNVGNGNWEIDNFFKIYYRNGNTNYYLTNNGTNAIRAIQEENQAATWSMTAVNGGYQISTVISGTTYYLAYTQSGNQWIPSVTGPTLSPTASTWQYANGQLYATVNIGYYGRPYYLLYNNGWTIGTRTNNSQLTFVSPTDSNIEIVSSNTTKTKINFTERAYIDTSIVNGYFDENGEKKPTGAETTTAGITYFPLSTTVTTTNGATTYQINKNNTGYIVGAEWDTTTYDTQDASASNLRISSYTSNVPNQTAAANPYTISYKTKATNGNYQFTQVNVQLASKDTPLTTEQAKRLSDLGLQKYAGCYNNYLDSVSDNSWEGLHFMNAPISMDNLTTITAHLSSSKEPIEGYQVPTNCIDFNLYDKGFINVVAGSYYTYGDGNDSFFSIYQIERYEDGKRIKSIKEISKIYAKMSGGEIDTSYDYYYTYVGDSTESVPAGYEMVFDCHWITHSDSYTGWANSRAYYFEVPVNKGEYAIGSTQGRTGAYLVYLDLAANAQILDRVKDYEKIIENQTAASIPKGVEILSEKEAALFDPTSDPKPVDPFNSAFVSVNTGSTGTVTVEKTDDTIKVTTDSGGNVTAEYISVNTVLTDKTGGIMSIPITQTTTIERVTYRDKNKTTGDLTVTVLTETTVVTKEPNGTTTTETTYTKTVTVTDKDGNPVKDKDGNSIDTDDTITDMKDFAPDTLDPTTGGESVQVGKKFIDLAFVYGAEVQLEISYSYQNGGFDSNDKPTGTYVITIKNPGKTDVTVKAILTQDAIASGITFIINGTALEKTNAAQTVTIEGENKANEPTDEPTE